MNKTKTKKSFSYRDLLYKVLIFIGTVAIIVYFLPRDGKFNYQFDIDKPWKYGQLMATFDFPIYKDDAVVKREQDSILAAFQPYYQLDKSIEKIAISKLKADYQSHLRDIVPSSDYMRYLEKRLSEIYKAGILSTEGLDQLQKDSTTAIMVIDDKLANQRSTEQLFSVKDAYTYLLTADTAHYSPFILRQCSLNEYLYPNLSYDEQRTETAKKETLDNYAWANGIVVSGQKIIDRGEIIDQETYNILESLRKESIQRSESLGQKRLILTGQTLFVGIFILCFMLYLDLFRKDYYERKGSLSLLFTLIMFYCVVTALMVANNLYNVYIIPYAMLPVIIRVFLDSRTAFLTQVVTILICSICLRYPHEFILLQLAAGLVAIFSLRELSQRSQLFRTALLVILTYAALYFSFELITENDLSKLNGSMYTYFTVNGVLLLFTYPLLFLLEKTFGFTSNVTLVELSNINSPLLRRLSETVPGTFQHSMQVANLAAEAANRIGAKSQLVRTGALYHDIGKMENPVFFTENQSGGVNPHKNLSYEQSAQVIISHVTDGLKLFRTALLVILTYAALYFSFELITENDLSKLNGSMYTYFTVNGVLLLFTYPLLFLLEKTFGFTSNVTLVELSNINSPLLRRLSETVPGTFQHSMQVANLAAEAANRIGAKSQLVRTGALYHDIGKMENPVFFTENQSGGVNPHKNLSYEQSAQVIISHVTDGLKLAEKNNLPKVIKDFISTHHGRGKTKYFYISWKNEHPDEEPNEELFTYPGPNPFTRETAILMMADAVEAASRSLPEYTEDSINNLVDKIIDSQVEEGYFKECPITFKDIATVKSVFKEKLKTIYHTRISYPELKK